MNEGFLMRLLQIPFIILVVLLFLFCTSTDLQNVTVRSKTKMLNFVSENFQKVWNFAHKEIFFDTFGYPKMDLAVVACGTDDRVEETLVNIKSAVLFSKKLIKFHIFTEDNLKNKFRNSLDQWPESARSKFKYKIYSIDYPNDGNAKEWKKLFKLCASQRLFLPHILKDVDLLLYVDTDIIFLSPVDDIWDFFYQFNSTHLAAMSPEHEMKNVAWYSRFARHPYYGETGINSGVMLLDMNHLRKSKFKSDLQVEPLTWQDMMLPLYKKYKLNITFGDQDLLNIIFHYNPEMLKVIPCHWNYRPDHCMYSSVCKTAEHHGVKIMHGSRRAYHNEKWPTFKAIYSAVESFNFNDDLSNLIQNVSSNIETTKFSNCKKSSHLFINGLKNTVLKKEEL